MIDSAAAPTHAGTSDAGSYLVVGAEPVELRGRVLAVADAFLFVKTRSLRAPSFDQVIELAGAVPFQATDDLQLGRAICDSSGGVGPWCVHRHVAGRPRTREGRCSRAVTAAVEPGARRLPLLAGNGATPQSPAPTTPNPLFTRL